MLDAEGRRRLQEIKMRLLEAKISLLDSLFWRFHNRKDGPLKRIDAAIGALDSFSHYLSMTSREQAAEKQGET